MNPQAIAFLCCGLLMMGTAHSADSFALNAKSTVNDFSLQCQHSALKTDPARRTAYCTEWLQRMTEKIGSGKNTEKCWLEIQERAFPMAVYDGLVYLAALPAEKKMNAELAVQEVVLAAAKSCR